MKIKIPNKSLFTVPAQGTDKTTLLALAAYLREYANVVCSKPQCFFIGAINLIKLS